MIWGKGAAVEKINLTFEIGSVKRGKGMKGATEWNRLCYITEMEAKEGEPPREGSWGQKDTDKWREQDKL